MVLDMEGKPRGAHSATKIGYESQSLFIRSPSVALVQLRMPVNQSSMPIPSIPCMLNLGISSSARVPCSTPPEFIFDMEAWHSQFSTLSCWGIEPL